MQRTHLLAAVIAAALTFCAAQPAFGQATRPAAEHELLKVRQEWYAAYFKGNTEVLANIEASDFVVISDRTIENQRLYTNMQNAAKAGRWFPKGVTNMDDDNLRVRLQGDMAVITGSGWTMIPGLVTKPPANKIAFTEVWVKREGRWRIMQLHYHQIGQAAAGQAAQSQSSVEQEIIRLERLLSDSLVKKDFDAYASYLADDYTEIRANGRLFTKEQVIQAGKRPGGKMERYDLDDLKVRVYGDTAIVTGRYSRKGTAISLAGQPFEFDEQGRFSDLWVKRQERWLCVSNQDTAISAPPATARPQPATPAFSASTFPLGIFTAKDQQGTWVMEFKYDGTLTVKIDEQALAPDITYTVKNNQLEISAGTSNALCSGKGTYKWAYDGKVLSFQLVSDPNCQPRQSVLTGNKFIKQP